MSTQLDLIKKFGEKEELFHKVMSRKFGSRYANYRKNIWISLIMSMS